LALAFAGCLGGDADTDPTVSDAGAAAPRTGEVTLDPPSDTSVKTGDLEIKVKDDLGTPFPGATITVTPSTANSTLVVPPALSDAKGVALFKGLPAQGYRVEARAEGHETTVQGATVVPGKLAKVELKLKYIIVDASYNVTVEFSGRVTCAAGAAVVVTCALVREQTKAAGKEHANDFRFPYGSAATPPVTDKLFEVWVEAVWPEQYKQDLPDNPSGNGTADNSVPDQVYVHPTGPVNGGRLTLFNPDNKNANQATMSGRGDQTRPVRVVLNAQTLGGWIAGDGGVLGAEMGPQVAYSNFAYVLDMPFTIYATVFYNGPADPCYSPAKQRAIITQACLDARKELGM